MALARSAHVSEIDQLTTTRFRASRPTPWCSPVATSPGAGLFPLLASGTPARPVLPLLGWTSPGNLRWLLHRLDGSQVAFMAGMEDAGTPCPSLEQPGCGRSVWDDSGVPWDEAIRRDLEVTLDEVARQLRDMPRDEIVGQEDLAWSLDTGVEVEVEVQCDEPLILRLDASKGFVLHASAHRIIRIDPR